ncbi:UPF0158 family protein [Algoriphagus aquimarinus]|mgnify:CR=1 FL=1|uniref:UPF0158 family protein n=1 Tax=Algoriphagus aquimarinus TaxID=237018 RepID=UPI0030DC7CD1|tara:strand:- start:2271 stop:2672 length:402 start_codon:yes stop_codon:yes gene_type:complete
MKPTEKDIAEIADWLDCGMFCFYHKPTGVIESHPDPEDPFFDPEPWEELIEKIESDWNNYKSFEKMDSREGFQVMEDFAHSLSDFYFREKLLKQLSNRKPFQSFRYMIDESEYRQDWFDFKKKAYIEFVKGQI